MKAVSAVVADMRKIIRQDPRIIQKLHRRVFLDKITREQVTLYVSFYVEAANRDAFMAIKQDLFLAFVDCVERNGAKLAKQRVQVRGCFTSFYGNYDVAHYVVHTASHAACTTSSNTDCCHNAPHRAHPPPVQQQLEFAPSVPATLPADSPDDSKPALPAPVDVAATGIPPEPPLGSNGNGPVVPASVTPASPPPATEAAAASAAAAVATKVKVAAKPADAKEGTAKEAGSEVRMCGSVCVGVCVCVCITVHTTW